MEICRLKCVGLCILWLELVILPWLPVKLREWRNLGYSTIRITIGNSSSLQLLHWAFVVMWSFFNINVFGGGGLLVILFKNRGQVTGWWGWRRVDHYTWWLIAGRESGFSGCGSVLPLSLAVLGFFVPAPPTRFIRPPTFPRRIITTFVLLIWVVLRSLLGFSKFLALTRWASRCYLYCYFAGRVRLSRLLNWSYWINSHGPESLAAMSIYGHLTQFVDSNRTG